MQVTVGGETVQHCAPAASDTVTSVLSREYDGTTVYSPPSYCSPAFPTLTVVHGDLHTPSCTAEEVAGAGDTGLSAAVVGEPATFRVVARDAFGNIRYRTVRATRKVYDSQHDDRAPNEAHLHVFFGGWIVCVAPRVSGSTSLAYTTMPNRCLPDFRLLASGEATPRRTFWKTETECPTPSWPRSLAQTIIESSHLLPFK